MVMFRALLTSALASIATARKYVVTRPESYKNLPSFDGWRGPDPYDVSLHLTGVRVQSDLCAGLNDVLAVTLAAPIVGDISPADFSVEVCPWASSVIYDDDEGTMDQDRCETITPACARLQLEDEPSERRTVLLFGQFVESQDETAVHAVIFARVYLHSALVDGNQTELYGAYTYFPLVAGCVLAP